MSRSTMKEELHVQLYAAQERWFTLRETGVTKHDLKLQGLRERGDMFYCTRTLLFTGATRTAYERELKPFLDYCHDVRGKTSNRDIDKRDFRAYMEDRLAAGGKASHFNKMRSAITKFLSLYGKYESAHAMSKWLGARIREMKKAGLLQGPDRPHITPQVQQAAIDRLKTLDAHAEARTGQPRGYHLALELQKEGTLRAIEATERFRKESLLGVHGDRGLVSILGKGGRVRQVDISKDLYVRLATHFDRAGGAPLASLSGYRVALSRACVAVGGRTTASHANRRESASRFCKQRYFAYRKQGLTPAEASQLAAQDAVERLGHSRNRKDVAAAYLAQ